MKKDVSLPREVIMKNEIENAMNSFLNYSGKSKDDYFRILGISAPTFYRRLKNPFEFTLTELKKIASLAGIEFIDLLENLFQEVRI